MSVLPKLQTIETLKDVVSMALEEAVKSGATQASAEVSDDAGLNISVRDAEAEVIEHTHDRSLSVTVYIGQRTGRASSGDLSSQAIERTVRAALDIAKYTSEDDCAGLPDPKHLCKEPKDLSLYHPWDIDTDGAIKICQDIEEAAFGYDPKIVNSDGVNLNTSIGHFVLGNTEGFLAGYPYSNHYLYGGFIAENSDGMQRDYGYTTNVDAQKLRAPEEIGKEAAKKAVDRLSPKSLSPRNCPVIFESRIAGHLIQAVASAASGGRQYRKSSFLQDALGKTVMNEDFSIFEDPFVPACYGSDPFDEEGVCGSPRFIVESGRLCGYFLGSYTARKLGMETTGNAGGPYNLYLQCRPAAFEKDLPSLLKCMGTGLLVTELAGEGMNLTTGDYSRGCSGFWVENGVIAYPVDGITVAGNLKDILLTMTATAGDINYEGSVFTGSILIDRMTVAGNGGQ